MIEPWSKFYWSDYDADEGLRVCSLAAQGLWMRMLCLMARATPKGELRIGGEPCSVTDLSRAVGESEETVAALLDELRRRGVFSVTRTGVMFSRRMRKDAVISRKRAEAGRKGGNASLGKQRRSQDCSSKSQAKYEAKSKPQKPEARYISNDMGEPPTLSEVIWGDGLSYLIGVGMPEKHARSQLGKWRKRLGEGQVAAALAHCQAKSISDPNSYIEGITRNSGDGAGERQEWLRKRYGVDA